MTPEQEQKFRRARAVVGNLSTPASPILFSLCVALILITGWFNDYSSCKRSNDIRSSLATYLETRITAEKAAASKLNGKAAREVTLLLIAADQRALAQVTPPLDCLAVVPEL